MPPWPAPSATRAGKPAGRIPFANCSDCHRRDPHQGRVRHGLPVVPRGGRFREGGVQPRQQPLSPDREARRRGLRRNAIRKAGPGRPPDETRCRRPAAAAMPTCISANSARGCESCHTTRGFAGAALKFDHQTGSAFPLQGKHASISCRKCHLKSRCAFPGRQGRSGAVQAAVRRLPRLPRAIITRGNCPRIAASATASISFAPAPGFDHQRSRFSLKLFHEGVGCRAVPSARQLPCPAGTTAPTVQYRNIRRRLPRVPPRFRPRPDRVSP